MNLPALFNSEPVTIVAFLPSNVPHNPILIVFHYNTEPYELSYASNINEFTILVEEDSGVTSDPNEDHFYND